MRVLGSWARVLPVSLTPIFAFVVLRRHRASFFVQVHGYETVGRVDPFRLRRRLLLGGIFDRIRIGVEDRRVEIAHDYDLLQIARIIRALYLPSSIGGKCTGVNWRDSARRRISVYANADLGVGEIPGQAIAVDDLD